MTISDMRGQSETTTLVYAVCDRMLREGRGREITAREVRKEINYGSMKTINDGIASWWDVHGMQVTKLEQLDDLSPDIVSALVEVVHLLGKSAAEKAGAEYETKHQADQKLVEKAEVAQAEAVERLDESQTRVKELEYETRLQKEKIEHLTQDLQKSETERLAIQGEIKQIRQDAADKVNQVEKRLQELEITLTKENRRFDEMQNHYAKVIDNERTERKQEAAQSQNTITDLNKEMSNLQKEFIELKSTSTIQEKVAGERIDLLQSNIDKLNLALEQSKTSNVEYQKTIAGLTAENKLAESSFSKIQAQYNDRTQQCQELKEKVDILEKALVEPKRKKRK